MSQIQAIVRKTSTTSLTFTGRPAPEVLQKLKDAGFRYEKGNWFVSKLDSRLADESDVARMIGA